MLLTISLNGYRNGVNMTNEKKKRTRGYKYTDEQIIFMAVLCAVGKTKVDIALLFNTDVKTIRRCIDRAYKTVYRNIEGKESPFSAINNERACKLIYVGSTTDIERVANQQYDY